jgi:hypothetical protein
MDCSDYIERYSQTPEFLTVRRNPEIKRPGGNSGAIVLEIGYFQLHPQGFRRHRPAPCRGANASSKPD